MFVCCVVFLFSCHCYSFMKLLNSQLFSCPLWTKGLGCSRMLLLFSSRTSTGSHRDTLSNKFGWRFLNESGLCWKAWPTGCVLMPSSVRWAISKMSWSCSRSQAEVESSLDLWPSPKAWAPAAPRSLAPWTSMLFDCFRSDLVSSQFSDFDNCNQSNQSPFKNPRLLLFRSWKTGRKKARNF